MPHIKFMKYFLSLSILFSALTIHGQDAVTAGPSSQGTIEFVQFIPSIADQIKNGTFKPEAERTGDVLMNPKMRDGNHVVPGKGTPIGDDPLLALQQNSYRFPANPPILVFDADPSNYTQAANELASSSGFDLQRALIEPTMGGLRMMQTAPRHRVLLILTSTSTAIDLDATLALARTFQISVYVGCTDASLDPSVRLLCEGSGGTWAEGLTTTEAMSGFVLAAISHAKTLPTQRVEFDLPSACAPHCVSTDRPMLRNMSCEMGFNDRPSLTL